MSVNANVLALIETLKKIPSFSSPNYANRLHDKARNSPNIKVFSNTLPSFPTFGPDPDSLLIDNVDASAYLTLLAEATTVAAISALDPSVDSHNLRSCANQSNAHISNGTLITNLTSLLYGEYINNFLRASGVSDLATLSKQAGFADAFAAQLKVPQFIQGEVYTDLAAGGDHKFSLSLLFACDYLHHGPGLIPRVDGDYASAPSSTVISTWTHELPLSSKVSVPNVVAFCSKAASIVCATTDNGHVKPMPISIVAHSIYGQLLSPGTAKQSGSPSAAPNGDLSQSVNSALNNLQTTDVDQWQSIAQQILLLWNNNATKWQSAVASVATQTSSTTVDVSNQFGEGFVIGLTLGLEDHKTLQTTTITGQAVADWINEGYHSYASLFNATAPSVATVTSHNSDGPVHSCFVAGTQVTLASGSVAIEKLTEGMSVLTRADPQQFGTVSDEDAVNQLNLPLLVGINDDEPFFTPGHVFYTTTGLRAVVPSIAVQENSWLEVGVLGQGHVLLKLARDGKSYEHIEIKSIRVVKSETKTVYGVHLRDGLRSYHANGYLVAVNYPEITVKSVAKALAKVPRSKRIGLLQSIKELDPLFRSFGVDAISKALGQELKGHKRRDVSKPVKSKKPRQTNIRHAKRTFKLLPSGTDAIQQEHHLPQVNIHEGIVRLDNQVEQRAIVDADSRTIRWSRELPKGQYEHGYIELRDHGMSGAGAVLVSPNSDQAALPTNGSAKIVPFTAVKANVTVSGSPVQSPLEHTAVSKLATPLSPPSLSGAKPLAIPGLPDLPGLSDTQVLLAASAPTSSTKTTSAAPTPSIKATSAAPPPPVKATAAAPPVKAAAAAPPVKATAAAPASSIKATSAAPTSSTKITSLVATSASSQPSIPSATPVPSLIDGEDYYNLTLDKAVWPPGQTVTTPKTPVNFGQVAFATYHSGGAGGLTVPIFTVPVLDQLLTAINQVDTTTTLKSLYSSDVTIDDEGNMMGDVTFDQVALVAQYADQNTTQTVPTLGLTFTKALKSNITLPILFSRMQVSVDALFINATGAAYEFDPSMRGSLGNKHFLTNETAVPAATIQTRVATSNALASRGAVSRVLATPAAVTQQSAAPAAATQQSATPAIVTHQLATVTKPSVDDLISTVQQTYNDTLIHSISGGLLQQTMLYHMNSNDRTNFLQLSSPTALDSSLGANLATDLHNWIQNTYAVAFVSYMISQTSDQDQQTWRQHFTDDEKGKIWYWFSGQGATCLSQSKEYNDLNSVCAQVAMKEQYFIGTGVPTKMATYYNNGESWAKQMYTQMSTPVNGINPLQSLLNHPIIGNTNVLNCRCNILNTLDPSGNYANLLFNDILALSAANLNGTPYIGLNPGDPNPDQRSQFVTDAMHDIIVEILNGSASSLSWDSGVQTSLQSDLTQLEKDEGLDSTKTADERAADLMAKATVLVDGIANVIPALATIGGTIFKAMSGWKKASAAYDYASAKLAAVGESKAGIALKGIGTIVMIGFSLASAIKSFMDFNALSPAERSIVIMSTLQIVVDSLKGAKDIFDRYKKYQNAKAGTTPDSPQQVKDSAILDQNLDEAVAQSAPVLDNAAQEIAPKDPPDLALEKSVAKVLTAEGMPTDNPITGEVENNVKVEDTPKSNVGLGGKGAAESFSVSEEVIKGLGAAVGIGMTVSMAFDLKNHWGDLNELGQALNTIQVITTGLTVLCDIGEIVAETAVEFSLFAVSEAVLTAIPFVGAVLAVVGIVVMIVMEFENTEKPQVPPPTPVESFISGPGRTLISSWLEAPGISLSYTVQPNLKANGPDQEWKVAIANNTSAAVSLNSTDISFNTGNDATCLFTDTTLTLNTDTNISSAEGVVSVGPANAFVGTLRPSPNTETVTNWDVNVTGVPTVTQYDSNGNPLPGPQYPNPTGLLLVPPKSSLEVVVAATACPAQGPLTVTIVETLQSGDKARLLASVTIK